MTGGGSTSGRVDFDRINTSGLSRSREVLEAFLPGGRVEGQEYIAMNPNRADKRLGSFKINLVTGKGADFSSGDRFGDLIAVVAYVERLGQREAAIRLAEALGVHPFK